MQIEAGLDIQQCKKMKEDLGYTDIETNHFEMSVDRGLEAWGI